MSEIVQDAAVTDGLEAVKARLEDFGREVMAGAVNRPVQLVNGGLYLRGLIEQGPRKSLEPMCQRLGEDAEYGVSEHAAVSGGQSVGSRRRAGQRR
jgi:hypothetical protein